MRSSVYGSVVYSSCGKPWNSEPVDLSTTRSVRPAITHVSSPSIVTTAVRISWPVRTNEWSCGRPSTGMRAHE